MTIPGETHLPPRLASIDIYRGLVMFLMMAEVLNISAVARKTHSPLWEAMERQQTHVEWVGCVLHDMIQPSFSFLVGAALPFSIASRRARGQSMARTTTHAVWRALVLICLGFFLRSVGQVQTNFTFEDTLTQIGMGYAFLFLLGLRPARDQWVALATILVGYWAAFALYPVPGAGFDYEKVGVSTAWLADHGLSGFAAHWNKNSNLAWRADVWFLNLFPRQRPFTYNGGGYATLSFIPTLATMILGLLAGGVLRGERPVRQKMLWLCVAGITSLGLGLLFGWLGACPIVKRIWTPSWVMFSGGICFLSLATFYGVADLWKVRAWAMPLIVIGMNSIAAYCIAHLFVGFFADALKRHVAAGVFTMFGSDYRPFVVGSSILLLMWLILFWMYRRGVFLRI
jgi:predicted acyltransferase